MTGVEPMTSPPPLGGLTSYKERLCLQRSSSNSSKSMSPIDKRLKSSQSPGKRATRSLRGRIKADEISLALDMAGDFAAKLDTIIVKLSKLDSIEATLKDMCNKVGKVESEVEKLKSEVSDKKKNVKEMDEILGRMNRRSRNHQLKNCRARNRNRRSAYAAAIC